MNTPDPLEPRIYGAEVPFVASPRPDARSGRVPWQLRTPGAVVPWGPACAVAFVAAVFACLLETANLLIGGPRINLGVLMLFMPWPVHLSRPHLRWWALAAAVPFFAATFAVGGYLQVPLVSGLVFAYTAVTHIPSRDRSGPAIATYVPGPVERPRRAAGTLSATDVARSFFTNRANPRPEDDLADMGRGMTLYVSAKSGKRWGRLVLEPENLSWQPHRARRGYGPAVRLDGTFAIEVIKVHTNKPGLRKVAIITGAGRQEFTVTEVDVDLLRAYGSR